MDTVIKYTWEKLKKIESAYLSRLRETYIGLLSLAWSVVAYLNSLTPQLLLHDRWVAHNIDIFAGKKSNTFEARMNQCPLFSGIFVLSLC
jgi:hypothetical protein